MALMRWSEKMSVGVPELDADHKELIKVINQLGADAEDEARRNAVRQSLFALLRYAEYHFAREEKVMAACRYPGVREHKLEHRDFVDRINRLHRRFDDNPEEAATVVNEALLNFLQDWLNHHILIEDMAYRPHAEYNPAARNAAKSFKATEVWWSR
jgi:hemerythrin